MNAVTIQPNQQGQSDFINDWGVGSVLYEGGWASGKTWAAARKFLVLHSMNKCDGLVTAPTVNDLFRFCVKELKEVCEDWGWDLRIYPLGRGADRFPHATLWGKIIHLISADDPSRFSGFEVGHIWIDEGARIKQNTFDPLRDAPTQIMSRLRSADAKILQCIVSTTPEGTDTWIQDHFTDNPKPNHRRYEGDTEKNTAVPQEYIDGIKGRISEHLQDQYLRGKAASIVEGIAHPTFSDENISSIADWRNTTVHIGMDFNVSPLAWVCYQEVGDKIHQVDELFIEDFALVDDGMEAIKSKGWGNHKIVFHPDQASGHRSTTGDGEFETVIKKANTFGWDWSGSAHGANPSINLRINNYSRMLCDAMGYRRLLIHPRCTHTIEDLRRTTRKSTGGYDPGPKKQRGHILDGGGYALWGIASPREVTVGKVW